MINNVVLVGRLTKDIELKYTESGLAIATFTLAVNRPYKSANGDREADFIQVVIWRQQAENLAAWAHKGTLIGITGSIQTRNYENQQGQRVYVTEVVASNFQLLESRQQGQAQNNQQQSANYQQQPNFARDYQSPYGEQQQGSFFQGQTTNPLEISDDDLPF